MVFNDNIVLFAGALDSCNTRTKKIVICVVNYGCIWEKVEGIADPRMERVMFLIFHMFKLNITNHQVFKCW